MRRAAKSAASRAWASSLFATTINPDVSLSRRWTMPGRLTPPMPARLSPQWARSALTSVRSRFPGAGWTTSPAGLCDAPLEDEMLQPAAREISEMGRQHAVEPLARIGGAAGDVVQVGAHIV